jgi:hypothetical protein
VVALIKMLVRLMLPVSLIETQAFKDFMQVFDPSFNVPTRNTVKTSGLDNMFNAVQSKIQNIIDSMTHVNVSVDGWSDAVIRCYTVAAAQQDKVSICLPQIFKNKKQTGSF